MTIKINKSWVIIGLTIICALLIIYICISHKKPVQSKPITIFKPDAEIIKKIVYLKAENAILLTENDKLKDQINSYVYKKPADINGNDSDLARSFRSIIHQVR
jgi:hypothetical protein